MGPATVRTQLGQWFWLVGSAAVTALAYLLQLGWNEKMKLTLEEPGFVGMECTGPHEPSEVITLAVVLAVLVVLGAWFGHEYLVPGVAVSTVTLLYTVDAVTVNDPCSGPDGNGLLLIGVFLLLVEPQCRPLS